MLTIGIFILFLAGAFVGLTLFTGIMYGCFVFWQGLIREIKWWFNGRENL
jgi:hypothetical protein